MTADSMISQGDHAVYTASPKCWVLGEYVIGVSGNIDYLAALGRVQWPGHVNEAWRRVKESLEAAGVGVTDGETILGFRGQLWSLSAALFPLDGPIAACGSGAPYVIGSLSSSSGAPEARVREAVAVAARYSLGVGGRIVVASTA